MKTLKGYIPTMTMFVLLLIGATTAQAGDGVIINSIADTDSDTTSTVVSDGVIINSIVGVIINSIAGNYTVSAAPGIMVSD
jgi:hypothetical protein